MRTFKYILVLSMIIMAVACDRSDESSYDVELPEEPTFDETTVYGKRMKKFYDDYGVWCQYNVPSADLFYAWTTSDNYTSSALDYEYEEADPDYIVEALDFLENEVMVNLPSSILDEYMGLYIALEGRIFFSSTLDDSYLEHSSLEDYPELSTNYEEPGYGWNGSRYLLLAPVGPEFDETDKDQLKREWTALIFYEALKNLPNPDEFDQNNQAAWDNFFGYFYVDYIVGNHENEWDGSDPYSSGLVGAGVLKVATLYDSYDDEETQTGYNVYISKWYDVSECLDAFADYVAYIMYASAEEKAEIRSKSSNILVNEELDQGYCKKYLNWEIPELGE